MKATLKDIAARVGVTSQLVSFYLNHPETTRVARETREKIDAAVKELNYRPNSVARALCTGKTGTIGLIMGGLTERKRGCYIHSLMNEAKRYGYHLLTAITNYNQREEQEILENLPALRQAAGDRAVLRALHFFADDRRVGQESRALESGDFDAFLHLVKESGRSSWMYLQNINPAGAVKHQEMAVALAAAEAALKGRGACRVHGGGFAGTIQAFVPLDLLDSFKEQMERMLGEGRCHVLSIRPEGGAVVWA